MAGLATGGRPLHKVMSGYAKTICCLDGTWGWAPFSTADTPRHCWSCGTTAYGQRASDIVTSQMTVDNCMN